MSIHLLRRAVVAAAAAPAWRMAQPGVRWAGGGGSGGGRIKPTATTTGPVAVQPGPTRASPAPKPGTTPTPTRPGAPSTTVSQLFNTGSAARGRAHVGGAAPPASAPRSPGTGTVPVPSLARKSDIGARLFGPGPGAAGTAGPGAGSGAKASSPTSPLAATAASITPPPVGMAGGGGGWSKTVAAPPGTSGTAAASSPAGIPWAARPAPGVIPPTAGRPPTPVATSVAAASATTGRPSAVSAGDAPASATPSPFNLAGAPPPTNTADAFQRMKLEFAKLRAMKDKRDMEMAERRRTMGGGGEGRGTSGGDRGGKFRDHGGARGGPGGRFGGGGGGREGGGMRSEDRFASPTSNYLTAMAASSRAKVGGGVSGSGASKGGGAMFGRRAGVGGRMGLTAAIRAQRRAAMVSKTVTITDEMTVKDLALQMGLKAARVLSKAAEMGESLKEDDVIDPDVAEILVQEYGQKVKRVVDGRRDAVRAPLPSAEEMAEKGYPHRPPIVTVMGHVDHGKTTLLDALRGTNVAEKEAGGITQNVAAFAVSLAGEAAGVGDRRAPGGKAPKAKSKGAATTSPSAAAPCEPASLDSHVATMTFLDTPGHALFSSMRRRGTALTDLVVLVVDGKDGVMPQTRECVKLIVEADVAVVVAVTKCDVVDSEAAVASVSKQLLEDGLATESMGGDVPIIPISARTGTGLQQLKEALALQAEMLDLRAKSEVGTPGEAVILDARAVKGAGVVVDCVVRWGRLTVGDFVVAGVEYGRVKALQTDGKAAAVLGVGVGGGRGKGPTASGDGPALVDVEYVTPGLPVRVLGLKGVPEAGQDVLVVESEERAKAVVEGRDRRAKAQALLSVAEADAIKRAADREAYHQRRHRMAAYESAVARERKRFAIRKAGGLIPADLQLQPWEAAILAEGQSGKITGLTNAGRKIRQQGGQQMAAGGAGAGAGVGEEEAAAAAGPKAVAFIIKADSAASLVALQDAVARVSEVTREVLPRIVHAGVGEVSEKDVQLASDMGAHILAFNAKVPQAVQKLADRAKLNIRTGRVIYHVLDEVCDVLTDYMAPTTVEEQVAVAEVKAVFNLNASKKMDASKVAGCVITEGAFSRSGMSRYRVVRVDTVVGEVKELASLMHLKDRIDTAKKGTECGMALSGFDDYQPGDKIIAVRDKVVKPKLEVRFD